MRALISFCLIFLAVSANAGVSGGGTGPRPEMDAYFLATDIENAANLNQPFSGQKSAVDFVKTIGFDDSGKVLFQYKGFDSSTVEKHSLDLDKVNHKYLDALEKSRKINSWVPVTVEDL